MTETGQQVAQRTPSQELARKIEGEQFREQIAKALPPNVTVDRFQRALLTAVMQNPDIAKADHQSIALAAIRCAQDGLLPDGRQAAIAVFGGQATYMPMIGGLRHALADYGWTLVTRAVYADDQFEYSEQPMMIKHTPAPRRDEGELAYAYAIATHRDGRRLQRVVFPHEVEKRRKIAKTQNVWKQWPAEMWEKTAGHILFDEIPLEQIDPERDRLSRIVAAWEQDPAQAVTEIYGREIGPADAPQLAAGQAADEPPMEPEEGAASDPLTASGGEQAGGDASTAAAGSSPEPTLGEPSFQPPATVVDQAAQTVIVSQGKTINEILDLAGAEEWLRWALTPASTLDPDEQAALELVVRERLPELWAETQAAAEAA